MPPRVTERAGVIAAMEVGGATGRALHTVTGCREKGFVPCLHGGALAGVSQTGIEGLFKQGTYGPAAEDIPW